MGTLKTIEDATPIRRRILTAFERAERETDFSLQTALLTFAISGAGPPASSLLEPSRNWPWTHCPLTSAASILARHVSSSLREACGCCHATPKIFQPMPAGPSGA